VSAAVDLERILEMKIAVMLFCLVKVLNSKRKWRIFVFHNSGLIKTVLVLVLEVMIYQN
jgi:hypothetical protein